MIADSDGWNEVAHRDTRDRFARSVARAARMPSAPSLFPTGWSGVEFSINRGAGSPGRGSDCSAWLDIGSIATTLPRCQRAAHGWTAVGDIDSPRATALSLAIRTGTSIGCHGRISAAERSPSNMLIFHSR
jgi:hypothetical protein